MHKAIFSVSILTGLVCLSAFAVLRSSGDAPRLQARTEAPDDMARFIAHHKFITGQQYLTITNVASQPEGDRLALTFDVAWDAAWHDDLNRDAAWIFVKGQRPNADWQPLDGEYAFGGRGGSWRFSWNLARTSDRFKGLRTRPDRRAAHIGFRGVRTATSAL